MYRGHHRNALFLCKKYHRSGVGAPTERHWTWTCIMYVFSSMDMDLQHGLAVWTCKMEQPCSIDIHTAWTWTYSMDMNLDMQHVLVHAACQCPYCFHVHAASPCPYCMSNSTCPCCMFSCPCSCFMSMPMLHVHVKSVCLQTDK